MSGWGTLYSDGPQPDKLQETTVTVLGSGSCGKYAPSQITSQMLCASGPGGKATDSCQGDSGGD